MPSKKRSVEGNGLATVPTEIATGREVLPVERCLEIYRIMVRARAMEERMIKMSKSGEGYFWIGGPGEEAFNACLGLQIKKGCGPEYDFLHFHYRNSATLVAMGMSLLDGIRQMAMTATDPHSRGRNFSGHYCCREWNVVPITSVIGIQWARGPGSALLQKRLGGDSITIITGGEAGTHEGDFQSCLVWSTRPGVELPVLMIIMNNGWGISTSACSMHSERCLIDRGVPFGIPGEVVDGNDPISSWHALKRAMSFVRLNRRPYLLESHVSRLYGHSSSSGALRVKNEVDCIELFEKKLLGQGVLDQDAIDRTHEGARAEADAAVEQAMAEPKPLPADIEKYTYADSAIDAVYPEDYTGLPIVPSSANAPVPMTMPRPHDALLARLQAAPQQQEVGGYDVFLSYSSEDTDLASQIKKTLTSNGINCFFAAEDIALLAVWEEQLRKGIDSSRVQVVLLTPNSVNSAWVMVESGAFWVRGKPVIVATRNVKRFDVPQAISKYQAVDISDEDKVQRFGKHIASLLKQTNS